MTKTTILNTYLELTIFTILCLPMFANIISVIPIKYDASYELSACLFVFSIITARLIWINNINYKDIDVFKLTTRNYFIILASVILLTLPFIYKWLFLFNHEFSLAVSNALNNF